MDFLKVENWPTPHPKATDLCKSQNEWLKQLTQEMLKISKKLELVESENAKLKKELATLKKEKFPDQTQIERISFSDILKKNHKQSESEIVILSKTANEINERKRIEKNIVISGADENKEADETAKNELDFKIVSNILSKLGVGEEKIKKVTRLNSVRKNDNQNNKNSSRIVVEISDTESKNIILKKAKILSGKDDTKNIFINSDKTRTEREVEKRLRAERNERNSKLTTEVEIAGVKRKYKFENNKYFYWGIRNEKLVLVEAKEENLIH